MGKNWLRVGQKPDKVWTYSLPDLVGKGYYFLGKGYYFLGKYWLETAKAWKEGKVNTQPVMVIEADAPKTVR